MISNDDCTLLSIGDDFSTYEPFCFENGQDYGSSGLSDTQQCPSLGVLDQNGDAFDIFRSSQAALDNTPFQDYLEKCYSCDGDLGHHCPGNLPTVNTLAIAHSNNDVGTEPLYGSIRDDSCVSLKNLELHSLDTTPCSDISLLDTGSSNEHAELDGRDVDLEDPFQWRPRMTNSQDSGKTAGRVPTVSSGMRQRRRPSTCADWLQRHGLAAYPDKEQLNYLALAEDESVEQVRIALSNRRTRERKSKQMQSFRIYVADSRNRITTICCGHQCCQSGSIRGQNSVVR